MSLISVVEDLSDELIDGQVRYLLDKRDKESEYLEQEGRPHTQSDVERIVSVWEDELLRRTHILNPEANVAEALGNTDVPTYISGASSGRTDLLTWATRGSERKEESDWRLREVFNEMNEMEQRIGPRTSFPWLSLSRVKNLV